PRRRGMERDGAAPGKGSDALANRHPGDVRVGCALAARPHFQRMAGGNVGRERSGVGDAFGLRRLPRRLARPSALMRIIAGTRKGHTIFAPKGLDTRPTSDRVREKVFKLVTPLVE